MSVTAQAPYDVRCEWGAAGVAALADCRVFVVVDVLSFSSSVAVAAERGVEVIPHPWRSPDAAELARRHGALLAGARGAGPSLSPASLRELGAGTRLVLPSPNGAAVVLAAARHGAVLAGCLRNRAAVAARAAALGGPVAVIPAGERWPDGSLRPALEDLLGAGAIIMMLPGTRSPEAEAAAQVFQAAAPRLAETLRACASGRELIEGGFPEDVELAAALDASDVAPLLDARAIPPSFPVAATDDR
jgi:2-phosphosulfolactate phosphatase